MWHGLGFGTRLDRLNRAEPGATVAGSKALVVIEAALSRGKKRDFEGYAINSEPVEYDGDTTDDEAFPPEFTANLKRKGHETRVGSTKLASDDVAAVVVKDGARGEGSATVPMLSARRTRPIGKRPAQGGRP